MAKWKDDSMSSLLKEVQNASLKISKNGLNNISISEIDPFPEHPFTIKEDDSMQALIESISENGIRNPILVRSKSDGRYEVFSGHRRIYAAKKNGLTVVPAIIESIDDETAQIIMVDSNLTQRENILPSEKAFAYNIKLEAIKSKNIKGGHSDHLGGKIKSRDILSAESGESSKQIQRYIRLTYLIKPLLDKVDTGVLGFISAVDLSYLSQNQQETINGIIDTLKIKPTKEQALQLKKTAKEGELTQEDILNILLDKQKQPIRVFKYSMSKIKKIIPEEMQDDLTEEKLQEIFDEALQLWKEKYNIQ